MILGRFSSPYATVSGIAIAGVVAVCLGGSPAIAATTDFSTVGAASFTVPSGVNSLQITAIGGGGGGVGKRGGHGAVVQTSLCVLPNQVLSLFVGGGGATNSAPNGAAGGGSTSIDPTTSHRIIAGGGGGSASVSNGTGGDGAAANTAAEELETQGVNFGGPGGSDGIGGSGSAGLTTPGGNGNGGSGGSVVADLGGVGFAGGGDGGDGGASDGLGGGGGGYGGGAGGYSGGGAGGSAGPTGSTFSPSSNGGAAHTSGGAGSISIVTSTVSESICPLSSGTDQVIVAGGVVVPKSIPLEGKRLVLKAKTVTNAGQKVKVSAKCTSRNRGDLTYCRLIRTSGGSTVLKTYGYHLKIRLVWKAPAANGYAAYKKVKYYTN